MSRYPALPPGFPELGESYEDRARDSYPIREAMLFKELARAQRLLLALHNHCSSESFGYAFAPGGPVARQLKVEIHRIQDRLRAQ